MNSHVPWMLASILGFMTDYRGAFGEIAKTRTRVSPWGVEVRADEFRSPFDVRTTLLEEFSDDVREGLTAYPLLVGATAAQWHADLTGPVGRVLNHATNDLVILLEAVGDGDGRTAARTARVIFEHLINMKEVLSSREAELQFEAHHHVTAVQMAELEIGIEKLSRPRARKERQRLKKLARKSRGPLEAAVARYGRRFRARWSANLSLYDLAEKHGFKESYDHYRLLSGIMHGSSGSLVGTRRDHKGFVTHRLGPDYQLVPLAFLEGIRWWMEIVDSLPSSRPPSGWDVDVREGADILLGLYEEVFETCRRVDSRTWPEGPAFAGLLAVAGIFPSGTVRWYAYDPREHSVRLADVDGERPVIPDSIFERASSMPTPSGRPVSVSLSGVRVIPKAGARPYPAGSILMPTDLDDIYNIERGNRKLD